MKKLFVLLMALGFIVTSCNNNKSNKNQNLNNRDKDDYGRTDNRNNDEDKTNENTGNMGWSQREKNSFLKGCKESFDENQGELANRICPCVLEKMEKEFASMSEADTKGGEAASERLALQCKDEIIGNNGNNNNNSMASGWSSNDINVFVSSCVSTAVQGGMSQALSQKYCSCMQQKFEQMFPDPKDAGNITEEQMNSPSMVAIAKNCLNGN